MNKKIKFLILLSFLFTGCSSNDNQQENKTYLINGGFETSTTNAKSISFPGVASTMMACPDMEVEGKILKAMNEVKSFDKLSGGGIGLYDANNALVIVLEK